MNQEHAIQKQVNPVDKLKAFMRSDNIMERFQEILGERGARAYVSSIILAVANSEALQKCTQASIVSSALRAATLSLSCDPAIGQAYLVPYGNVATFVVGYKGLRDMALRTNKYRYIHADKVYKGEGIEIDRITGAAHMIGGKESSEIAGWVASFEMSNGFRKTVYMSREEIHEHAKKYSKGYERGGGVWKQNPDAMEKKTVLRQLLMHWGTLDSRDELFMNMYDEGELDDLEVVESNFVYQPEDKKPVDEAETLKEMGFNGQDKNQGTPVIVEAAAAQLQRDEMVNAGKFPNGDGYEDPDLDPAFFDPAENEFEDFDPDVWSDPEVWSTAVENTIKAKVGFTDPKKLLEAFMASQFLAPNYKQDHLNKWASYYIQKRGKGTGTKEEALDFADNRLANLLSSQK